MSTPFLQIKNISKTFPGVKALDNINLEVKKGEIHVLVGENGAGKSTLIKILAGVYQPDSGEIYLNGQKIENNNPQKATRKFGIVTIYQDLNLIPILNVADNIFLGHEIRKDKQMGAFINQKAIIHKTQEILRILGQDIDPTTLVGSLGMGKQQMIEIAKSLSMKSDLIVLDEPTAALGNEEIKELFKVLRQLKNKGNTIIFISHRLEEVAEIGDRLTVLRDGKLVITEEISKVSADDIIHYMIGREIENKFPKIESSRSSELLRVENLNRKEELKNISFKAYQGEILGISGLMGAGRTELARAIIGADPIDSGDIYISGTKIAIKSPKDALKHGLVLLTEDRKDQGLFLYETVLFNFVITNLKKYLRRALLNIKQMKKDATKLIHHLRVKTPNLTTKVSQLSGGNQQKMVISKWLNTNAKIFIFDEPTRGIDVRTKVEVYNIMNQLIKEGAAIIVISSELPEILGISDRIIVMHEGKITGEFDRSDATQKKLMKAAIGILEYAS
ncbi:MAG: sugar ABC transporter ATP-binding protein [Candidatus Bathyarchaeota archaeon]|nr:sugar ABC transporter ATP-binding protein [Candidatus Bathyarchaeota archaeon]